MKDLYSTMFYKISFSIKAQDSESDLLWIIVSHIKKWMTKKHNTLKETNLTTDNRNWTALKNGGVIDGNNIKIESEYCFISEVSLMPFWACRIIETFQKDPSVAPRKWTTEIGVEPVALGEIVFSCIVSYNDRPGFIGKCDDNPFPSVPKIIRNIWEDTQLICFNGIDKPNTEPQKIAPGEWLQFWNRVKEPRRTLPYIYISPQNDSQGGTLLIDPRNLSLAIGGNALVFYADDVGVTEEMDYFCPNEYKCYGGALRIYYPGINESTPGDDKRHRYLGRGFIIENGENIVIQILRRAIAQDAFFSDQFFRMENCRSMREEYARKKRLDVLKSQHMQELAEKEQSHIDKIKDVEEDALSFAEEAEKKQLEAEDLAAQLEKENDKLRQENYNLRTANDAYILLAKENADLKKVCDNRLSTKEYPKDPLGVVQYFEASFGDKIAFSDDAIGSLKYCSIPPVDLWKVFYALATIMDDLYINGNGDIYKEFHDKSGIDISRGEGSMTRKDAKLMRQYETEYHGKIVDIEAHITFPRMGQSIHFGFSSQDQKLIVGWCGEHKDNYTTKKIR